jgi:hypothetical protein
MKAFSAFIIFLSLLAFLTAVISIIYPLRLFYIDGRRAAAKWLRAVPAHQ